MHALVSDADELYVSETHAEQAEPAEPSPPYPAAQYVHPDVPAVVPLPSVFTEPTKPASQLPATLLLLPSFAKPQVADALTSHAIHALVSVVAELYLPVVQPVQAEPAEPSPPYPTAQVVHAAASFAPVVAVPLVYLPPVQAVHTEFSTPSPDAVLNLP